MNPRSVIPRPLVGLAAAVLLAGCGGSSSGGATGSSGQDTHAGLTELAKCARANGEPNFPDPVQLQNGEWVLPPSADNLSLPDACTAIKQKMRNSFGNETASAAGMTKLLRFAQCVRDHGVKDWPDPEPDGTFILPDRIKQVGDELTAGPVKACVNLAPGGNFEVRGSSSTAGG
jgi:hypothetical protein